MKHYLQIDWHIGGQVRGLWGTLGEQLLPLRMPLFFAVSGFFAVRAVQRPWPTLFHTKVAKFYYLYVIWLVVHTAVLAFGPLSSAGPGIQWIVALAEPVVLTAFLAWLCLYLHRLLPGAFFDLPFGRSPRSAAASAAERGAVQFR